MRLWLSAALQLRLTVLGVLLSVRLRLGRRAWSQFRAFGEEGAAPALEDLGSGGGAEAARVVAESGVVRLSGALSSETSAKLRQFILNERDVGAEIVALDDARSAELFSRVLSASSDTSAPTTRWDVRLPWDPPVEQAVREMLSEGSVLGDAFCTLSGGDAAVLWECAAIISRVGAAPQIVHGDTVFTKEPELHTAFVASG